MDADTPLWKAHDLSQQLQDKIEVLPNVERAFVHVDYETTHYPVRVVSSPVLLYTDWSLQEHRKAPKIAI
jgi:divalent metal cation (Fe/Co/Zn/Cd) transporter